MRTIHGVVTGVVKDLDDPDKEGKVRLSFPWLDPAYRSAWAPIAVLLAGKQRGGFFMPELEDEALVAFEHGNFDHPFVVGFLWNGKDTPPHDKIDRHVRRLRTVSGHVLEFDDRSQSAQILLKTKGEQSIELDDAPSGKITIQTKQGQKIVFEDSPTGKLTLQTKAGVSIVLDDASSAVTIKAPTSIALKGSSIELGEGASEKAVLGDKLKAYLEEIVNTFNSHQHAGETAGGFPVSPMSPSEQMDSPQSDLLSDKVKGA